MLKYSVWFKAHFICLSLRWINDSGNEADQGRKNEKEKRKWDLQQRWSTYCHSSINPPVFSLCAPHPPCLPSLKAAAVFVWSAKTLLPLLAFHQGCMGEMVGRKVVGGCLSGWVFFEARGCIFWFHLSILFWLSSCLDAQFPIDISSVTRDHDFLDRDAIEALCRWDNKSYPTFSTSFLLLLMLCIILHILPHFLFYTISC